MHRIPSRQLFIYAMAWVVLSAVPSRAQEHIFEEVGVPTVPPVRFGAVAMGDYDGDGDLDVLLTGARSQDAQPITRLYRNDGIHGSSQTEVAFGNAATMEGVWQGAVTWGDYDNDGDLDLAVAGLLATGDPSTMVYTFESRDSLTVTSLALPGVWSSDLEWGDYDNDGDLDLAVCGRNGSDAPVLVIHENLLEEGLGFSVQSSELGGVMDCTLEWGD